MPETQRGFTEGDYVIATDADWDGITWKIVGFRLNLFNQSLAQVEDISNGNRTVFYPYELRWEDGTAP